MGITASIKKLGIAQVITIAKLHQANKLPQGLAFDKIVEKILPSIEHLLPKASQKLLATNQQNP